MTDLDLQTIDNLTGGRIGTFDVPCPMCAPQRTKLANQKKLVLRVWRIEPGYAGFHCARCGQSGYARDGQAARLDSAAVQRARAEAPDREHKAAADRLSKARWLWSKRRPIGGSIAEAYLRKARGYTGMLPATLGFLPARGEHGPAMIAAFGMATEPEAGRLQIADADVRGIHITRLAADGTGKAGTDSDKLMIGMSAGSPIVLAPPNDLLGLAIAEGIEDALSVHGVTGLGAWAAGSASRLPAIAPAVPAYIEAVTIIADSDMDGRRHATELARRLRASQPVVRLIQLETAQRRAA